MSILFYYDKGNNRSIKGKTIMSYVRTRSLPKVKLLTRETIESQLAKLIGGSYRIDREGISQSLMGNWTCRVKFCMACQRWTTPDKGKNTYFGTMCHDICEYAYKAKRFPSSDQLDRVINNYIRKNKENLTIWTDGNIELTAGIVKVIMGKYFEVYADDLKKIRIVDVENKFEIPFGKYLLRGKIDMVFSYLSDLTTLYIMEHKTMGTVNENVLRQRLPIDKQNLFYLIAASKEKKIQILNLLYNIIRRPQIKKTEKESIPDFCNRLGADINSRPEFYYMRYPITYTVNDLNRYETQLLLKLGEIDQFTIGKLPLYRNDSACESAYNGTPYICEYIPVCQSNNLNGFIQQKHLFPELED